MNGHKNWTHWNVSLWINNDEGLYREARRLCTVRTKDEAARELLNRFPTYTPDGAKFSFTAIRAALRDL